VILPEPFYEDELVQLYLGDCRELLPLITADVLITDPPYGIGYEEKDAHSRGARVWGPIVGDDAPFDPAHLLALKLPTVLFGGNHYASRLPDSPSWWVWYKREGMKEWDQSDCELMWTNIGGPARVIVHDWWGGTTAIVKDGIRAHPTQKPVGLMAKVIERCPPGIVLDPYAGSGTTLVAAKALGRRSIGIEIEERHCRMAAARCGQETLGL
jgi:site-specific DNA-methyltransferase (adenine-specific)